MKKQKQHGEDAVSGLHSSSPTEKMPGNTLFEIGTLRERVFRWLRNSGQKRQGQTWGLCEGAESDTFRVLFVLFCF